MFDDIVDWIAKYPLLHIFSLTFIFFGLVLGWVILVLPFYVYDCFKKDFTPYFSGIKDIWENRKETK